MEQALDEASRALDEEVTPNEEHRASLSEADLLAYQTALHEPVTGCMDATSDAAWESWDAANPPVTPDIETFEEVVASSDGAAALADYESSMGGHGYVVSGLYQIFEQLFGQRDAIVDGRDPDVTEDQALAEWDAIYEIAVEAHHECVDEYDEKIRELVGQLISARYNN